MALAQTALSRQQQWLIAALRHSALPPIKAQELPELINAARLEGVLLLAESRLQSHPQRAMVPYELLHELNQAAHSDMLEQLAMLAEQAKVFSALTAAQMPFLVLKGGALAHWLYAQPALRVVTDLDILLPTVEHLPALEAALAPLGYRPVAGNAMAIETAFEKAGGPYGCYCVDAHWQVFNSMQLRDVFEYEELARQAIALPGQPGVLGLSPVHAMLNACGHRAIGLPNKAIAGLQNANALRWLWDMHAMAGGFGEQQWLQLLHVSGEKHLSTLVHEALCHVQQHFATRIPEPVLMGLLQHAKREGRQLHSFTHWRRYQWQEFLASAPHWRGRIRWLWHTLTLDSPSVQARYGTHGGQFGRFMRRLSTAIKRALP